MNNTKSANSPATTKTQFEDGVEEIVAADFTTPLTEVDNNIDNAQATVQVSDADTNVKDLNTAIETDGNVTKAITSAAADERLELGLAGSITVDTQVAVNGDGGATVESKNADSAASDSPGELILARARNTIAAPASVFVSDNLGQVSFQGHDGTDYRTQAKIRAIANQVWGGSARGTRLEFQTTPDDATGLQTGLIVRDDGQVEFPLGIFSGAAMDVIWPPTYVSPSVLSEIQFGTISSAPISTDYEHLLIALNLRGDTASTNVIARMRLNNTATSTYKGVLSYINASGVSAAVDDMAGQTYAYVGFVPGDSSPTNHFAPLYILLSDYKRSNQKHWISFSFMSTNGTGAFVQQGGGYFNSTSVIEQINILPGAGNWDVGSSYALYGIGG